MFYLFIKNIFVIHRSKILLAILCLHLFFPHGTSKQGFSQRRTFFTWGKHANCYQLNSTCGGQCIFCLPLQVRHAYCYQMARLIFMKKTSTSNSNQQLWPFLKKRAKEKRWNLYSNLVSCNGLLWSTQACGHYGGDQDLPPPLSFFSFCVNMFLLYPNWLLTSTQKQIFIWQKTTLTAPSTVFFCQSISTCVLL